jgi:YihY family inner membrane protein
MSTANVVPETWARGGEGVRVVLARARVWQVIKDSALRFRWADGFSHARALAFQTVLTLVPGMVVAGGVATVAHNSSLSTTILRAIDSLAPGPTGQAFRTAAAQGSTNSGAATGQRALVVGAIVMLFSAATTFGQIERGANRIYGVEKDRPSVKKYGLATLLALTAGAALAVAFMLLAFGRSLGGGDGKGAVDTAWLVLRWPAGALLLVAGYAMVFRLSPRRHQPGPSWLAAGAAVSVLITLVTSVALAFYLNVSSTFGDTYGPLGGIMGVMLWSYLSAIGLFLGLAFCAELEAVRAGAPEPQSVEKVVLAEPASTAVDEPLIVAAGHP